jgi:8-oxo-dGTP pyrophosphatase MutT (NUDIX family)
MNPAREAELASILARYGTPLRCSEEIVVGAAGSRWWTVEKTRRRDGEVVLFIRRRDGTLLLHTKDFYPPGAVRVPSGGIKQGEPVLAALWRETAEETGLVVEIDRLAAVVDFTIRIGDACIEYPSYSFLLREVSGVLRTADEDERISGFSQVTFEDLNGVATALENLTGEWREWGLFRAIPHRLVAQALGVSKP